MDTRATQRLMIAQQGNRAMEYMLRLSNLLEQHIRDEDPTWEDVGKVAKIEAAMRAALEEARR